MHKYFNPSYFKKIISKSLTPLFVLMILSFATALYHIFLSPEDYQQKEMVKVMYVHVPAAWMSLGIYCFIAICSLFSFVWKLRIFFILGVASSYIGATFALITLVTGSIWGKPIWGTWWVWDARLTSMLILFLLYLGYIAVISSGDNFLRSEKPAAVIALIGAVNVPIVKFSVNIWYSLHQPASIIRIGGPAIDNSMMLPLMLMFLSFILYFFTALFLRTSTLLTKIKYDSRSS